MSSPISGLRGDGLPWWKPFEHHLVAVLVGVRPVQDVGGVGLEPLDVVGSAPPGHHGEPGRLVVHAARRATPLASRSSSQCIGQVVEDDEVLGERHVVRAAAGPGSGTGA